MTSTLQSAARQQRIPALVRKCETAKLCGTRGALGIWVWRHQTLGNTSDYNSAGACERRWRLLALDQAVDADNHFITLGLRIAPQISDIFLDARVHNFNAEQCAPLSRARSASDLRPRQAAALSALAPGCRHLEPLEALCPDADEPR